MGVCVCVCVVMGVVWVYMCVLGVVVVYVCAGCGGGGVCVGVTLCLEEVASHLQCPVYGIQLVPTAPLTSIEALAGFYLQVSFISLRRRNTKCV